MREEIEEWFELRLLFSYFFAIKEHNLQKGTSEKEQCPGCGKLRVLDDEEGVCKKCLEHYQ